MISKLLQLYVQELHTIKPAKIPVWLEKELMKSHFYLSNHWQLMASWGQTVLFRDAAPKRGPAPGDARTAIHIQAWPSLELMDSLKGGHEANNSENTFVFQNKIWHAVSTRG